MLGLLGTLAKVFAPILKPIIQALQPVVKAVQTAVQQVVQQPEPQPTKKQAAPTTPTLTPEQQKEQARLAAEKQKEQARLAAEKKRQQLVKEKELGRDIGQASGMDIGKAYLQPLRFPAELTVAAKGSLLAQDVLYALKHEGKPQHLTDEVWLKRFARYGRDEQDSQQAHDILSAWTQIPSILIDNPIAQLAHQIGSKLRETTLTYLLEAARKTGDVELYSNVIKVAYGITVTTEDSPDNPFTIPELTIDTLHQYAQGAELMAEFYQDLYGGIPADRYAFFQKVMGDMRIVRTDLIENQINRVIEDSKGYTAGHTIYDRFERYINVMNAENFAHELNHSFVYSSSFGRLLSTLSLLADKEFTDAAASAIEGQSRENPSPDVGEVVPDALMNAALGNIPEFADNQAAILKRAIRNAIIYNLPVETYATALGSQSQTFDFQPHTATGINFRLQPGIGAVISSFQPSQHYQITLLGKASTGGETWLYVALPSEYGTQYGWIANSLANVPVENLSEINPAQVDPERPFSAEDPLIFANQ